MGVKRKHFDDASPTSLSSFGAVSTPDAQSPTHFPIGMDNTVDMELDPQSGPRNSGWDFARAHRVKSSDWGNRTQKRVRDNRPDERAVHENTVHKLFLAQRQHPHASPIPSDPQPPAQPTITVSKPQKSTLHSFWNISAPPVQSPIYSYQVAQTQYNAQMIRCEDCDAQLEAEEDGMSIDVDMHGTEGASSLACHNCGRNVCGRCAVAGDARHCLQCATQGC